MKHEPIEIIEEDENSIFDDAGFPKDLLEYLYYGPEDVEY